MSDSTAITRDSIRRYYDKNTKLFLRFGRENETYTIHRALWFQGITDTSDALDASNDLLRREWQVWQAAHPQSSQPRVLDLGCGVGGTLFYLVTREPELRALGITLSAVQAEIANTRAARLGLQHRALIVQGDFQAVPAAPSFAMAYSIEAFAHATHPEIYLQQAARVLTHGGRLILCDDFRAARRAWNKTERAWLDTYQSGWHIPNLQTVAQVQTRAAQVGLHLVTNRALTPHLKLRALPGRIARFVQRAGNHFPVRHPLIPSMMGSMALQQCLQSGLIEYRWLVFEKT